MICSLLVEIDQKHGSSNKTIHNIAGKHTLYLTIEPFDWHSLRHTYATLLYDASVDVLTAKELLGHTDVKTTMGIYTHLSKERKSISVDKLNRFIADQVKIGSNSD